MVTVTSTYLVHRGSVRLECHQECALAAHTPPRVVGVDERTGAHRTPQPAVGLSNRTVRTSECVPGDRPLAQLHPGQRPEHGGNLPDRNAHTVVEHVGRRHHPSPNPVRTGSVLVRCNVRMPAPDLPAARQAPAYPHPVRRDLGTRSRRNVGHVGKAHSLRLESASASKTCVPRHGHLYDRLCDLIRGRQLAVAEHTLTGLAPRPLGAGGPPALGERSRLALSRPLEFCELLAQPFVGRRQLDVLPLQLGVLSL